MTPKDAQNNESARFDVEKERLRTVEVLVNDGVRLATLGRVGADGGRGRIGDSSGGDNPDLPTVDAAEHLENGLELGRSEGVSGRVLRRRGQRKR